jgi:hypothetical protein
MLKYVAHSDDSHFESDVKNLLLFRKIVKVEAADEQKGILTLDDGTKLIVEGNEGCGGCSNGWFYLDELNGCDNAITDVECVCEESEYCDTVYHIFVFAEGKKINCLQYSGHDNGYYGVGYDLFVMFDSTSEGATDDVRD